MLDWTYSQGFTFQANGLMPRQSRVSFASPSDFYVTEAPL